MVYGLWAVSTGLALAGGWACYYQLRQRDRHIDSLLRILQSIPEQTEVEAQALGLCQTCAAETGAQGVSLYLQPGGEESGFRRAAQTGLSAEATGPGVVKDLLEQAYRNSEPTEASHGGRFIMAVPVWSGHEGGGALLLFWDELAPPGAAQRGLIDVVATAASVLAPRFYGQGALAEAQAEIERLQAQARAEIQTLQAELGEESHLASVGRLAAGVAHELNTPLGAVLAMVSSLLRKEDSADKAKRMNIVKEAVEKCKAIIQKLLVYSRAPVETEQGLTFSRFVRSETDLNKVIENTVELLRESFAQDEIAIETDLSPLPTFRANSTQWSHVFNNLLVNARDALRNTGVNRPTIKIRSGCHDDMIKVEVSDNGPGIPKDIRARIFEPFFTTKDVGHGTGLGLAICKEVVRKHQGNVSIGESEEGGAKFTIELKAPVAEEART